MRRRSAEVRRAAPSRGLARALLALAPPAAADEGMWTFDNPPAERLQEAYGFAPTQEWLDKVRLASVRFNDGGSGSFVSPDGLMITNHHVGLRLHPEPLHRRERLRRPTGFLAPSRDKEPACPGYEVNVLMAIEDVTARVLGAVQARHVGQGGGRARARRPTARIEKECADRTGQRCDVVTLYQGGEYHLYTYKKYTDVRLVFAPEEQTAFFGGDPDNFTFPRHDLDVCVLPRLRERPAGRARRRTCPGAAQGVKEGDLVFVSGNPGSTSRLDTMAQLESERDGHPARGPAGSSSAGWRCCRAFAARRRRTPAAPSPSSWACENSIKALQRPARARCRTRGPWRARRRRRTELRRRVAADAELAQRGRTRGTPSPPPRRGPTTRFAEYRAARAFGGSRLLGIAGTDRPLRAWRSAKPNDVRLEEFRDSILPSLENTLYSPAPIYEDIEEATLADRLEGARRGAGRGPSLRARPSSAAAPRRRWRSEAVAGTKLKDVAARKALVTGGPAAVAASTDSMIALARRDRPVRPRGAASSSRTRWTRCISAPASGSPARASRPSARRCLPTPPSRCACRTAR